MALTPVNILRMPRAQENNGKKQYLCTRSPGNSSPRYDAGDESGFFACMAQRDGMEIIPNARLADSISTL